MRDGQLVWQMGQRLVTGFEGTVLDTAFKETVKRWKIGNMMLSSRNLSSKNQIIDLCEAIDTLVFGETGTHPWIMVDQEGGMVSRLPADCAVAPGSMALAALGDEKAVYTCAFETAKELRSLGINANFAPVLDVNTNRKNPVIGVRSFGDDPMKVSFFSHFAIKGYMEGGVLCCGKHFPGRGDTMIDPHLSLPKTDKRKEELAEQLFPFSKAVQDGIPALLSSHVLLPAWEPAPVPGTMSRNVITGLLRNEMCFNGLVFSDFMDLQAIEKSFGVANGTISAMQAGIDQVLVSGHADTTREVASQLFEEVAAGHFDRNEWNASLKRIADAKEVVFAKKPLGNAANAIAKFDGYAQASITLVAGCVPKMTGKPLFVGPQAFAMNNVRDKLPVPDYPHVLARLCSGEALLVSSDPGPEEIAMVLKQAKGKQVYFGMYNAWMQKGQFELAYALLSAHIPLVVTCLRSPYDSLERLRNEAKCTIATWEYSERIFSSLADIYCGKGIMNGHMPVTVG